MRRQGAMGLIAPLRDAAQSGQRALEGSGGDDARKDNYRFPADARSRERRRLSKTSSQARILRLPSEEQCSTFILRSQLSAGRARPFGLFDFARHVGRYITCGLS